MEEDVICVKLWDVREDLILEKSFWEAVLCDILEAAEDEAAEGGAGCITEAKRILEAATLEAGYIILRLDPLENGGDADALDDNEEVPWV